MPGLNWHRRAPRTINVYRQCCFSLAEWAVKNELLDRNPVAVIDRRNEAADTRKVRRSLTVDEVYRLLGVSRPRTLFYVAGLLTGLRVKETRALQWGDIDFDGDRPAIRLRAAATKSKRADELPLHPDLATALRDAKPPFAKLTDRVFKSAPTLRTFKLGLQRARIPFADTQGRTVDRHALRTTFISWLGLYGVDPRAQIVLARHAPQGVTLKHYQDFTVFDLWAEIRKLPPTRVESAQADAVRATGTADSAPASEVARVAVRLAVGLDRKGVKRSSTGRIGDDGQRGSQRVKPPPVPSRTAFSTAEASKAGVAQLVRAPACGAGGPWFEPRRR